MIAAADVHGVATRLTAGRRFSAETAGPRGISRSCRRRSLACVMVTGETGEKFTKHGREERAPACLLKVHGFPLPGCTVIL